MSTLLVIDIGNTNVSLGLFDYALADDGSRGRGELSQHWRIGTHREQTSDEVALLVSSLFSHAGRGAGGRGSGKVRIVGTRGHADLGLCRRSLFAGALLQASGFRLDVPDYRAGYAQLLKQR